MKIVSSRFLVSGVLYLGLFFAAVFGITMHAEAAELPASCTMSPAIENFKTYIYEDGALHSFDYTVVGDGVPTVVSTVVGGHSLEGFYSTAWQTGTANTKKIHVDFPSWYEVSGETHIAVNVMTASSAGCSSQKEFVVQLPARPVQASEGWTDPTTPPTSLRPAEEPGASQSVSGTETSGTSDAGAGTTGGLLSTFAASFFGSGTASEQCVSWPRGTWIFLTVIAIAAVLVILDSLPFLLAGNGVRFAAVLLAMFLVLLALWFTFDRCHVNRWFPLVVTLITLGTLVMPTALEGKRGRTKKFPF